MATKRRATRKRAAGERRSGGLAFNHAMIYTRSLADALEFYEGALGFERIEVYPDAYARLKSPSGSTTIALHVVEPGQELSPAAEGLRLYFEVGKLDAFCKRLAKKGVQLAQMPKVMPWGWKHAYLRDPDGHEISLYRAGRARLRRTVIRDDSR
jgi:catechol 2,3-dioxygenase-like lactoylglutathione lyase family enzyme